MRRWPVSTALTTVMPNGMDNNERMHATMYNLITLAAAYTANN